MNLPHDPDAERACLGAVLVSGAALDRLGLAPEDFALPHHRAAFEGMLELRRTGVAIDPVTLRQYVPQRGVDDLLSMAREVPTVENVEFYAKRVKAMAVRRHLCRLGADLHSRAALETTDLNAVLADAQRDIMEITTRGREASAERVGDGVEAAIEEIERRSTGRSQAGYPSGIEALDEVLGHLTPGSLTVVGARPGVGKTALAMNVLLNGATAGYPGLVFSLEMGKQELDERLLSLRSGVPYFRIHTASPRYPLRRDEWQKIVAATGDVKGLPLWMDTNTRKLEQIVSEARRWRAQKAPAGPALVILDYAQLVGVGRKAGQNREQEVAEVSRSMKVDVAKGLGVAVILVSGLNRSPAKEGQRPRMHDLRESGAIEADADAVVLLHRDTEDPDCQSAEAIVDKNRHGQTGIKLLRWHGPTMAFSDIETRRPPLDRLAERD